MEDVRTNGTSSPTPTYSDVEERLTIVTPLDDTLPEDGEKMSLRERLPKVKSLESDCAALSSDPTSRRKRGRKPKRKVREYLNPFANKRLCLPGLEETEDTSSNHSKDTNHEVDSNSALRSEEEENTSSNNPSQSSRQCSEDESVGTSDARRKRFCEIPKEHDIRVPLKHGWRRQTTIRCISKCGVRGEVVYYAPCGKKLRHYPEVTRYIEKHNIQNVKRHNFSFSPKIHVGEYLEPIPGKYGKYEKKTEEMVINQVERLRNIKGSLGGIHRRNFRNTPNSSPSHRNPIPILPHTSSTSSITITPIPSNPLPPSTTSSSVSPHGPTSQSPQVSSAKQYLQRTLTAKEMQNTSRHHQMTSPSQHHHQSQQQQQQQQKQQQQQQQQHQKDLVFLVELGKEFHRQQMMMAKAIEAQREQEERERQRRKVMEEIQRKQALQKEQQELEYVIFREMQNSVEDMMLKDALPLPKLTPLACRQLRGDAFSKLLMVYEFVHNFGETLGFEVSQLPNLETLQDGILNRSIKAEEDLLMMMQHLLVCVIDDPGIPSYPPISSILKQPLKKVVVATNNITEVLRLYLDAHDESRPMCQWVKEKPFLAIRPSQKVDILHFVCNELLTNEAVVNQVDSSVEMVNTLRKDKWVLGSQLRRLFRIKQEKYQLIPGFMEGNQGMEPEILKEEEPLKKEEQKLPLGELGETDEEHPVSESEEDNNLSQEELDKKIERAKRQQDRCKMKLDNASTRVRVLSYGQDRFRRRYWALPRIGGIVVEGSNSSRFPLEEETENPMLDNPLHKFPDPPPTPPKTPTSTEPPSTSESETKKDSPTKTDSPKAATTPLSSPFGKAETKSLLSPPLQPPSLPDYQTANGLYNSPFMASFLAGNMLFNPPLFQVPPNFPAPPPNLMPLLHLPPTSKSDHTKSNSPKPWFSILPRISCTGVKKEENSSSIPLSSSTSSSSTETSQNTSSALATSQISLTSTTNSTPSENATSTTPSLPPLISSSAAKPKLLPSSSLSNHLASSTPNLSASLSSGNSSSMFPVGFFFNPLMVPYCQNGTQFPSLPSMGQHPPPSSPPPAAPPKPILTPAAKRRIILDRLHQHEKPHPIPKEYEDGWWHVKNTSQLKQLVENLLVRGMRESILFRNLRKHFTYSISICPQDEAEKHKEEAKEGKPSTLEIKKEDEDKAEESSKTKAEESDSLDDKNVEVKEEKMEEDEEETIKESTDEASVETKVPKKEKVKMEKEAETNKDDKLKKELDEEETELEIEDEEVADERADDIALRVDMSMLEQVESLEEGVASASMQVKDWQLPPRISTDPNIIFQPAHLLPTIGPLPENVVNPVLAARDRLLRLEAAIEKRYLKPPLGFSYDMKLSQISLAQASLSYSSTSTSSIPFSSTRSRGGGGCGGNSNISSDDLSQEVPALTEAPHDEESSSGVAPSDDQGGMTVDVESVTVAESQASDESSNQTTLQEKAQPKEKVPVGLVIWRDAVRLCDTSAKVAMCLNQLDSSIAWDKSVMKASCQFCCSDDKEEMLLLCDSCDRGYHTYCFRPELKDIPEGDWYCPLCLNKTREEKMCVLCCKQGSSKLISCDTCPKTFHPFCFDPPLTRIPKGKWQCMSCAKPVPSSSSSSSKKKSTPSSSASTSNTPSKPSESSTSAGSAATTPSGGSKRSSRSTSGSSSKKAQLDKEMVVCRKLLKELEKQEDSWPFLEPVNTKEVPMYRKVVKRPMDLSTLRHKLNNHGYSSPEEFFADAILIFDNCEAFNEDDSEIGQAGHSMRAFFEKRWSELTSQQ